MSAMRSFLAVALGGWVLLAAPPADQQAVATPGRSAVSDELRQGFQPMKLAEIDATITNAIAHANCPGAVLWLERDGVAYHRAYGNRAVTPATEPMTEDTIFDAASLTKVLACTPAVMLLIERGQVGLDLPVSRYLPGFTGDGKEAITVRQLLTHTSGLRAGISLTPDWNGHEAALQLACAEKLVAKPGERFLYSDTSAIVLGELVRHVAGRGLDEFLAAELYGPLKMTDTGFNPPASKRSRIAPTEVQNGHPLRGVVHDPRARRMGGVAGHAGLFTSAADMARFCRMMLNGGELEGVRIFRPETVKLMTTVQTPPEVAARRGLGWDIDSPYAGERGSIFPLGGYGHTGWTGTSVWIDPFSRTFVILLSNRNHPTEDGNVIGLRRQVATLAAQAVIGFNFTFVPGALPTVTNAPAAIGAAMGADHAVLNGIDVLAKQGFAPLRGLRLGLITNHTGHDRERNPTIDLLRSAPGITLKALFSPEHGIRGALDEKVADGRDERSGLPVFSLYGETRQPTPEQLHDLDALVFDVQDVGARFYTYISTLNLSLEAASKAGLKFFVLDRVNPIGGEAVEGPVYAGEPKFVACHSLPIRHGMTVGELAKMFNAERGWHCALTVVPCEGWSRGLWFDETGLPWTNPSPNLRSLTAAVLYPGVCLLERCQASVGRGTATPFEIVGAPYVNDVAFAAVLNQAGVRGVRFVPVRFTPSSSVFKDRTCGGAQLLLTDRDEFNAVDLGLVLVQTLHRLYPQEFDLDKVDQLLFDEPTLEALRAGKSLASIKQLWASGLADFKRRRAQYLLYP